MRHIQKFIGIGAFAILMLGIPAIASAQFGGSYDPYGNGRNTGTYGRNNGGYNNGAYGDMRSVVRNLKQKTRDFTRQLDRDLDNSRVNGSRREDQINQLADRFRDAVNNIDNNAAYGRRDNDVDRALQYGSNLERAIRSARMSSQSMRLWQSIRSDLQMLGNGYFQNDDRYNTRNRNGGYNTNTRRNLPSWWPF